MRLSLQRPSPAPIWARLHHVSMGALKVTGAARYPSDTPVANPAYAVLVTSAIAKGRIERLDLDEARAVPGVLDILTNENTGELKPAKFGASSSTSIQTLGPDIAHAGQIIAVVIADTFEAASEAALRVNVQLYGSEACGRRSGPMASQKKTRPKCRDSISSSRKPATPQQPLLPPMSYIDAEYSTPTQHHNPIELFTTTCVWSGDRTYRL